MTNDAFPIQGTASGGDMGNDGEISVSHRHHPDLGDCKSRISRVGRPVRCLCTWFKEVIMTPYQTRGLQVSKRIVDNFLCDVTIAPPRFRGLQVVVGRIEVKHSLNCSGTTPLQRTTRKWRGQRYCAIRHGSG